MSNALRLLVTVFFVCFVTTVALWPAVTAATESRQFFWVDRLGVHRAAVDGSDIEVVVGEWLRDPAGIALDSTSGTMYWTSFDKIQRANFDGTGLENLITGLYRPHGIALDLAGGKMYWTNWGGTVSRANLDGTAVEELVSGIGDSRGIAIDISAGKIYFSTFMGIIYRANLDGTGLEELINFGLTANPEGIALDLAGGKLYWTDNFTAKIRRANLDGTNIEDLVSSSSSFRAIALDLVAGKMYWGELSSMYRANLDGTGVEHVAYASYVGGIALDIAGGKMYWTEWQGQKIARANLDGTGEEDLVTARFEALHGLALDVSDAKMYWTDYAGTIQRANMDGSGVEDLVTNLNYPHDIALDTSQGKMYWIVSTVQNNIQRANLDGTEVEDVISANTPNGLALDVWAREMYWTCRAAPNRIEKANMDGTGLVEIVAGLDAPGGIALDPFNGKMYWTGGTCPFGKIRRANFDGTGVVDLVTSLGCSGPPSHVMLDLTRGKLYWTEGNYPGRIARADLNGTGIEDLFTSLHHPRAIVLAGSVPDSTTRHYVSTNGGNVYPYATPADAATKLSDAVAAAAQGDSVLVASGTFDNVSLYVEEAVLLYGAWDDSFATRDLVGGKTVLNLNRNITIGPYVSATTVIDGFEMRNGTGVFSVLGNQGGAIFVRDYSNARVANCRIQNCRVHDGAKGSGGGISAWRSTIDIVNTEILDNNATQGGGIYLLESFGSVEDCVITGNELIDSYDSVFGGGLCLVDCPSVMISRTTVDHNAAEPIIQPADGGGFYISGGTVTIVGGSISYNTAGLGSTGNGGGIYINNGELELDAVTITRNKAKVYGGAIWSTDSEISATDCGLFWNENFFGAVEVVRGECWLNHNLLVGNGGTAVRIFGPVVGEFIGNTLDRNTGMSTGGLSLGDAAIPVRNNIIVNSGMRGVDCVGTLKPTLTYNNVWGHSDSDYYGCVPGIGSISFDPLFADTSSMDYHLALHSPAIDAGDPSPALNDPDGSRGDMGYYGSHDFEMAQPVYPKDLAVMVIVDETIVQWRTNPESNVTQYAVYKDSTADFVPSAANLAALVTAPDTTDNDGTPVEGTYYKVCAVNALGYASGYAGPVELVDNVVPAQPQGLTGTYTTGTDETLLQWHPNSETDLSHYDVYWGNGADFVPSALNIIGQTSDTLITFTGMTLVEPMHFKLAAVDTNGNSSDYAVLAAKDVEVPTVVISCGAKWLGRHAELSWILQTDASALEFRVFRRDAAEDRFEPLYHRVKRDGNRYVVRDDTTEPGKRYTYLVEIRESGSLAASFAMSLNTPKLALALHQNYPNPFNPTTTIGFTIPSKTRTTLSVYSASGRLVRTLVAATLNGGSKEVTWDGTDDRGHKVGSGVYFYRLKTGKKALTRKMVLLK